jgi:membrane protein
MKNKFSLIILWRMLRDAFIELGRNDPLRMAGATAFFTTFALPPILIIMTQILGLVYNPRKISGQLFKRLGDIIGTDSLEQIINTLIAFRRLAQNWFITIGGFIFLLFIATTLFKIIKGSLNQLWRIKPVKKRSLLMNLQSRLQSVFIILITGVLFVTTLLVEGAQAFLGRHINRFSPGVILYFNSGLNYLLSVVIRSPRVESCFCRRIAYKPLF